MYWPSQPETMPTSINGEESNALKPEEPKVIERVNIINMQKTDIAVRK
jgi:hypothetical protein